MSFNVPEQFRVRNGRLGTSKANGNNGLFLIPGKGINLRIIASDGQGWDHVSVSLPDRCPTWGEMCRVKSFFWDEEDTVMQLHPPKSEWVNNHPYCLHLWRSQDREIPRPPELMVGIKDAGVLA